MKVVILAGGLGTRLSEYTKTIPKPMVKIKGIPIITYIINHYEKFGFNHFIIAAGYKKEVIKNYFKKNKFESNIEVIDTGLKTMTGGRLKRVEKYIDAPFCLTYGDGVSDINIENLLEFHKAQNCLATISAIQHAARFGSLDISGARVKSFQEKPKGDNQWINVGFFVCEPEILNLIDGDQTILEKDPLEKLANENQLSVFKHTGFWYAMDTLRDKIYLDELWRNNNASWKVWK